MAEAIYQLEAMPYSSYRVVFDDKFGIRWGNYDRADREESGTVTCMMPLECSLGRRSSFLVRLPL